MFKCWFKARSRNEPMCCVTEASEHMLHNAQAVLPRHRKTVWSSTWPLTEQNPFLQLHEQLVGDFEQKATVLQARSHLHLLLKDQSWWPCWAIELAQDKLAQAVTSSWMVTMTTPSLNSINSLLTSAFTILLSLSYTGSLTLTSKSNCKNYK